MAEIFREKVNTPMRVVTLDIVQAAIAQMGAPDDFGAPRSGGEEAECEEQPREVLRRQLRRSRKDRSIAGICGGIAEYFDIDPTLVRLAWIIFCLAGGSGVLGYIIAALVMPEDPNRGF